MAPKIPIPPIPNPADPGSIARFTTDVTGPAVNAVTGPITDISGFLSALVQKNTWIRIGEGVLGLILITVGVAALARNNSAVKTVAKATPVGKITKLAK